MPGVLSFGGAFFFTKFAVYAIALWLPSFLEKALHYTPTQAANVATSFSVGNFIGGFLLGWLSDLMYGRRTPVGMMAVAVSGAASLLIFFLYSKVTYALLIICLALMGCCLGGLHHLLCVTCSADIGVSMQKQGLKGTSTVTGIIDGLGSMGTSLG